MGILTDLWLSLQQKKATNNREVIEYTVTPSDESSNGYRRREDQEIVARVRQHVLTAISINVRSCVAQPMRCYRRKGTPGSRSWAGKSLSRHALKKYHANICRGKAIDYAGSDDFEEVTDAPFLDTLRMPNATRKGLTWYKDCWFQWWAFGKRFVYHVDGGPKGTPNQLWLLRAHDCVPIPAKTGNLLRGFRYGRSGNTKVFEVDEVMYQIMTPSPFNPYDAISPLHSVFTESDIYAASTISEKAMWENGARPDYALSLKGSAGMGVTKEQVKQAQEYVNRELRGPSKRGKILVTSEASVLPLNFSPREMEYLAGREDIKSDIYNAFGIPESMRKMNDSNRASAEAGLVQYARHTIAPALIQDAEEWTESYLPLFGIDPGDYWFAYDNPVPEDRESLRQDISTFVKKPVWTVDEARAELGFDPSPELAAQQEADQQAKQDAMVQAAEAKKSHVCGSACGHRTKEADIQAPQEVPAELTEEEKRVADDMVRTLLPWFLLLAATVYVRRASDRVDSPDELTVVEGEYVASISAAAATSFVERVKPSILRALRLGANRGVELLPEGTGGSPTAPAIGAPSAPPTRFSAEAAFEVVNEWAPKHLDAYTVKLADTINKTTLDAIKQTIKDGIDAGSSQEQIVQVVQAELSGMAPFRSKMIAVTETRRAYNEGSRLLWKKAGAWGKKIILAANPCPTCIAIAEMYNAEGLEIDEPFWSKGETIRDANGLEVTNNYQDADAPPFHPNCFCVLQPVFDPLGDE